jgi:hypothetical protein
MLDRARVNAANAVTTARGILTTMQEQPIVTVVEIDQTVPISTTLPFTHSFHVPIDTVYPLSTVVNTYVQIPILGRQNISLPIDARVPVQMDVDVPIQTSIPISFTYRLQMDMPVEFQLPPEMLAPVDEILLHAEEALR